MKFFLTALLFVSLHLTKVFAQGVGINATGADPNTVAGLDVDFTNKGVLVPRVTLTQTTSNSPIGAGIATSLLVYNTATVNDVTPGYYYWTGTKWSQLLTSSQGCTSCTTSGWTLVAVANTTVAFNGGWSSSGYTATAGKEVWVINVNIGSDINATTADVVGLAEYNVGTFTSSGGSNFFFLNCPLGTFASGAGGNVYSAKLLGRKLGGPNSATPVIITTPYFSAPYIPPTGIGLSTNGTVWIWDNSNTAHCALYIFER